VLCGYVSIFIGATENNRLGISFLAGMIICIIGGILVSDYFLDSFK
jgi:hypothetical protein